MLLLTSSSSAIIHTNTGTTRVDLPKIATQVVRPISSTDDEGSFGDLGKRDLFMKLETTPKAPMMCAQYIVYDDGLQLTGGHVLDQEFTKSLQTCYQWAWENLSGSPLCGTSDEAYDGRRRDAKGNVIYAKSMIVVRVPRGKIPPFTKDVLSVIDKNKELVMRQDCIPAKYTDLDGTERTPL